MRPAEIIATAYEALSLNKLRTALATLGIVIGIGAVIGLVSLGQASQKSIQNQIQSLGSNLLSVIPGSQNNGGIRSGAGGATTLTFDDANAIATSSQITTIAKVSPEYSRRAQIVAGKNNTNTQVLGATASYPSVHKVTMAGGTFITDRDVQARAKIAVLGPQVVSDLFGTSDPIGQKIRISGQVFRVVGTAQSKGGSGFQNQDDIVFVPLTTAQKVLFGADYLTNISLEAKNEQVITQAEDEVGYLLLARHHLSNPALADFSILSQSDILGTATQVTGIFTSLLSGIAAISLLVGGIGIMNIMLVTVIERTREIGLRKALGAKRHDIIAQFLTESILVTGVGGILGMLLGILLSYVASTYLLHLPFTVSASSILLAMGVSGAIGLLFGWYPAQKAARLSPIEALRYE